MKTQIKTIHEEEYSTETKRIIGVLYNYSVEVNNDWQDSLIYIYRDGIYIFFETLIEMLDYLMYAEKKVKRAYLEESEFDKYYDSIIDDSFTKKLKWQLPL
jgi:hypothetical protein